MTDEDRRIEAASLYGAATRKGIVRLSDQAPDGSDVRWQVQMSPDRARSIANSLLQAAEAAEMDEIVVTFLHERIGLAIEQAAQVLGDFRKIRDQIGLERGL